MDNVHPETGIQVNVETDVFDSKGFITLHYTLLWVENICIKFCIELKDIVHVYTCRNKFSLVLIVEIIFAVPPNSAVKVLVLWYIYTFQLASRDQQSI